jgi:hypothetical protein
MLALPSSSRSLARTGTYSNTIACSPGLMSSALGPLIHARKSTRYRYLDYHPSFEDVYKVVPCAPSALDCASKPDRRKLLLGGSVSQWGESVDAFNFDADVWVGASALAERLWSDPPLGDNATLTSMTAQDRHHALSCHWKMYVARSVVVLWRRDELLLQSFLEQ